MSMMTKVLMVKVILFSASLAIVVLGVGCGEYQENKFGSYSELENSMLIGKGWVPKFIPKSAYDIKERHRVDQPYINVEFSFKQGDILGIEKNCSKVDINVYECENFGYPVRVEVINGNYAKIYSVPRST